MRNPGLFSGGFHGKVASILSYILLSCRQDESVVSASYTLCFACTGGNARLQASVYFIPNNLAVVQKGFSFCSEESHSENAYVQINVFCLGQYKQGQVLKSCWSWNKGTNISASRTSGEISAALKKSFVRILFLLKEQIYRRPALAEPGWIVLALFFGEESKMKVLFSIAPLQVFFFLTWNKIVHKLDAFSIWLLLQS